MNCWTRPTPSIQVTQPYSLPQPAKLHVKQGAIGLVVRFSVRECPLFSRKRFLGEVPGSNPGLPPFLDPSCRWFVVLFASDICEWLSTLTACLWHLQPSRHIHPIQDVGSAVMLGSLDASASHALAFLQCKTSWKSLELPIIHFKWQVKKHTFSPLKRPRLRFIR